MSALSAASHSAHAAKAVSAGDRKAAADETYIEDVDPAEIEDPDAFIQARDWWRRGDRREALHYLEIALGSDWYGLENVAK